MIDISWMIEHGPCIRLKPGDTIPCPRTPDGSAKAIYILLVGSVDIYKNSAAGGLQKISTLISGDVFGGREYFTDEREQKYVAAGNAVVYLMTEDSFNDLSWSRPDVLFEILRAAYLPLRKPSGAKPEAAALTAAVQPTALAAQTAKDNNSTSANTAATTSANTTSKAASENKNGDAQAAQDVISAKSAIGHSDAVAPGGFFPDGHKNYSDYTPQMNMQLFFPKEYNCPFCKSSFTDFRVFRSKLYESQPMRYDLRKFYNDFTTEWFDVITCNNCLFSTFHNYFTDPKPIKKANIEKALQAVRTGVFLDFNTERDIGYVFTSHYLAILCAGAYPTMDKQIQAKLWGNLSWLYEDVGDKDMEKYAAREAAGLYEQVYTGSRLTPVQEQITCLSIAGMQYRAGIDSNLRKFLFTAKTHQMGDKQYAKIAEDFMYELKIENEQ